MKPGVYEHLSFAEYQAIDAVNASTLVAASKTLDTCLVPKEETAAMRLGILFHALILEDKLPLTMPAGMIRRGKAWEEWKSANQGREIASVDEAEALYGMVTSLHSGKYETARQLLKGCDKREVTLVWKDRKFGCLCKARLDGWHSGLKAIVDLKTGQTADPERWMNLTLRAGGKPHWQPSHYLEGTKEVLDLECQTFLWVLFETKPPYGIQVVEATHPTDGETDMVYLADQEMAPVLARYLEAKRLNRFPGRPDRVLKASVPKWYFKTVNI